MVLFSRALESGEYASIAFNSVAGVRNDSQKDKRNEDDMNGLSENGAFGTSSAVGMRKLSLNNPEFLISFNTRTSEAIRCPPALSPARIILFGFRPFSKTRTLGWLSIQRYTSKTS